MINLIHFYVERKRDIVSLQIEIGVAQHMLNILLGPGEVVIHAQHFTIVCKQAIAKM